MNVLLINGSPHPNGCVFTALSEAAKTLRENNVETTMFQLGNIPIRGCIACGRCTKLKHCVFEDEKYNELFNLAQKTDGVIIGSPVYYAGPNGTLCALLDRFFFSASYLLKGKPGAAIVNCRRGGASSSFDRLNKYFTINHMPVVSSQYWNSTHGFTPEDVMQDLEGLQTVRTLARNMAYLLKSLKNAHVPDPIEEPYLQTNFI